MINTIIANVVRYTIVALINSFQCRLAMCGFVSIFAHQAGFEPATPGFGDQCSAS